MTLAQLTLLAAEENALMSRGKRGRGGAPSAEKGSAADLMMFARMGT